MSIIPYNNDKSDKSLVKAGEKSITNFRPERLSNLPAPLLRLTGHTGEVYSIKFNPSGTILASASHDSEIRLWDIQGDCNNFLTFKVHHNAVLDIQWTLYGDHIVSCSADQTLSVIDVESNQLITRFSGHKSIVNSVSASRTNNAIVASASNDKSLRIWDSRVGHRGRPTVIRQDYPVTAVAFSKDGNTIFSGSIDNVIRGWDIRKESAVFSSKEAAVPGYIGDTDSKMDVEKDGDDTQIGGSDRKVKMELAGHSNTITGLEFSHDGSFLLSNSMDGRLRVWDTRPFAPQNRCVKIFQGHQHSFDMSLLKCAWSVDGRFVSAGSSDGIVNVWNTTNRAIAYKLTGHSGIVHDVRFHPREQIIASCSADKTILLGELKI